MAASATVPSTTFLLLLFSLLLGLTSAQLSANFYSKTCPNALSIIQTAVANAVKSEARMGASLLRLHFHDCFVNGCDASILLDDTANFTGEQSAGPNVNSIRGLNVIDNIKTQLEKSCVGVVSCADIVAVAARDSVVASGGDSNLAALDTTTPTSFDNAYFKNLQSQKGLLHSDQQLFNGGSTDSIVNTYSSNPSTFATDFANAMLKMSNLSPLTGTKGQIRKNCRKTN
nr:cationic peroxidase 1-like [Ipomoea batatas]